MKRLLVLLVTTLLVSTAFAIDQGKVKRDDLIICATVALSRMRASPRVPF